jgi:hypothetical protein
MYEDNGHSRQPLETSGSTYTPPPTDEDAASLPVDPPNPQGQLRRTAARIKREERLPQQRQQQQQWQQQQQQQQQQQFPQEKRVTFATTPYVPTVANQLRRVFAKANCHLFFKSGAKLQNVLCAKNKMRPPKTDKKGEYKLTCICWDDSVYVGETRVKVSSRLQQHKTAGEKGDADHSGVSLHTTTCPGPIKWLQHKSKSTLQRQLSIREALEILRQGAEPNKGLNKDFGSYVKTKAWDPVFKKIGKG